MTESTKEKILVIDDQNEILEILDALLSSKGYRVSVALGADEGLRKATDEAPNLILLDLMMPKKSGLELLKDLKLSRKTAKIPVIFLTGMMKVDEAGAKVIDVEGESYLGIPKPFNRSKLLSIVDNCFSWSHSSFHD